MRLAFTLPLALWAQLVLSSTAIADYDASSAWFLSLPSSDRVETQTDLILLDAYYYLVDGQFGTGTYDALTQFQKAQGAEPTGVLSAAERQALRAEADKLRQEFGLTNITDEAGQVSLAVPTRLLPVVSKTETGTLWATEDGGMTVETFNLGRERSFSELFDKLTTPGKGRLITEQSFSDARFVITGHQDGRDFYTMYRNTGSGIVGYQLTWSLPYAQRGNVLSIYIASTFAPVETLAPAPEEQKSTLMTASRRYGPFSLPADLPDVISLDGEVSDGFYEAFQQALEARPDARIMILNSPGGYVDSALAVAREVHARGMSTVVATGMGCYSACAYIFFAGQPREADGELGVHQISAEVADLVMAQTTLSDVIDALNRFGVHQTVIIQMLRTPPEDMYVFTPAEIEEWGVNKGGPVQVADVDFSPAPSDPETIQTDLGGGPAAFVNLANHSSEEEAARSLTYARDRWAGVLGDASPELALTTQRQETVYLIRVPARSMESANALCSAIKSDGGGCYVTPAGT